MYSSFVGAVHKINLKDTKALKVLNRKIYHAKTKERVGTATSISTKHISM